MNKAYVMPSGIRIGNYKGCNLLSENIQTLIPLRWLDDNVINAYMNLIERRSYRTGYPSVYRHNTHFFSTFGDLDPNHLPNATRKTNIFSYCLTRLSGRRTHSGYTLGDMLGDQGFEADNLQFNSIQRNFI